MAAATAGGSTTTAPLLDLAPMQVDGDAAPNKDSAFMQQRLPAWQPLMTPQCVIPGFLLVGAAFACCGVLILGAQADLRAYGPVEYSAVEACQTALQSSPCVAAQFNVSYGGDVGADALKPLNPLCVPLAFDDDATADNVCSVDIVLDEPWEGPVYVFYTLTNFYQNHRLYVADRADNQLTGVNSPAYGSLFSDPLGELPYQGCSSDALPGALFCTGTDDSAWLPVSYDNRMGETRERCEAGGSGPTTLPLDSRPSASGVWCACDTATGEWNTTGSGAAAPCDGTLPPELYADSKIAPPTPGAACPAEGDEAAYDSRSYGGVQERGGQCWAQFCNPCGRMARSFFTDKFKLLDADGGEVAWEPGAAFPGETGENGKYGVTRSVIDETADGSAPLMNVRSDEWNDLVTSMDFITWMRASILPRAKKLYRVIPGGLAAGTYTMEIKANYDPIIFDRGIKSFELQTIHSSLGGKNGLLGWAYTGVGATCVLMGTLFAWHHLTVLGDLEEEEDENAAGAAGAAAEGTGSVRR